MKNIIIQILWISLVFGCISCTESVAGGGGSTETVGIIYMAGVPAKDVSIAFVPTNHLPQSGNHNDGIDTARSNSNGEFSFSGLQNGTYNILYEKEKLVAFRNSISVNDGTVSELVSDTLKVSGTLSGQVKLRDEHNSQNVFIMLKGTNRFVQPTDTDGNFRIDSLAEGSYDITMITEYDFYSSFDTSVVIISGESDSLRTIEIEYLGLPTPKNVSVIYNPMLEQAKFLWSSVDIASLSGYQVVRKIDSDAASFEPIAFQLTDTFFVDEVNYSDVIQSETYLYRISSIGSDGLCGKWSDPISVTYEPKFTITSEGTLPSVEALGKASLALDANDVVYSVHASQPLLSRLSPAMEVEQSFPLPDNCLPNEIEVMDDGTFIIASNIGLYNVTSDGKKLYRYSIKGATNICSVNSQFIYYVKNSAYPISSYKLHRFNSFRGKDELLLQEENLRVLSMKTDGDELFVLYQNFGSIELYKYNVRDIGKPSQTKSKIYSGKYSGHSEISVNESEITVLSGNRVITFSRESSDKVSTFSLPSRYCSLTRLETNDLLLYNTTGKLSRISQN